MLRESDERRERQAGGQGGREHPPAGFAPELGDDRARSTGQRVRAERRRRDIADDQLEALGPLEHAGAGEALPCVGNGLRPLRIAGRQGGEASCVRANAIALGHEDASSTRSPRRFRNSSYALNARSLAAPSEMPRIFPISAKPRPSNRWSCTTMRCGSVSDSRAAWTRTLRSRSWSPALGSLD